MKEILDAIHKTIYQFFDVCGDDEEVPISDKDKLLLEVNKAICDNLKALDQESNTWSLDDAREDFMYDVYNTLDFLPTNEEANQIIDSFDRVTSSIKQEPRWIPVTERLPEEKGLYLVSVKNDHNRRYSKTCWFHGGDNWFARQDVLAWMPLPEPYKAESEDE